MTYNETLDYLFNQLPMYQRQGTAAYKADLKNTIALDKYFGHPHRKFKTIHIAGTNGKGSVSHILASVLQSAGYKTGLYTSPHLKDFRERVKINGKMISEDYIVDFVKKHESIFDKINPSFFEMTVALAFDYFAKERVDIAVIEAGMGGRLDSTNIISPILSTITNIAYDHTQFLGETIEKIAVEKAGIIKKNIPIVIGEIDSKTRPVFLRRADEENAPLFLANYTFSAENAFMSSDNLQIFNIYKGSRIFYSNLKTDLLGKYQRKNLVTAIQIIDILREKLNLKSENIFNGLMNVKRNTGFEGRWQILGHNPTIVCDLGHNEAGIKEVIKQIEAVPYKKLHFVLGTVNDKNIGKILNQLPEEAYYYFTKAGIPRALNENELLVKAEHYDLQGESFPTVEKAFLAAKSNAGTDDMIFVGGSTYVVAEVL